MMMMKILTAALAMLSAPAVASQSTTPSEGAPPAPADALYCLRVEPHTGSRLETIECWTREQWAEGGVDIDKDWPKEGVKVIEARAG